MLSCSALDIEVELLYVAVPLDMPQVASKDDLSAVEKQRTAALAPIMILGVCIICESHSKYSSAKYSNTSKTYNENHVSSHNRPIMHRQSIDMRMRLQFSITTLQALEKWLRNSR